MISKIKLIMIALAVCMCTANAQKISIIGKDHALMHLEKSSKYLLLPIEEKAKSCHIRIICNNKEVKSLNVNLAVDKVDYTVAVDLSCIDITNFLVDFDFLDKNHGIEGLKKLICWDKIEQSNHFDTTNREHFRPLFHHTPTIGWMNDPNGMFYKDGLWQLYYQHNPYGSLWENMTWGHSTSSDLLSWTDQGDAIYPDALGTIFSGSCVVDKDNTAGFGKDAIIAIYTDAGQSQTQCMAYSNDGGKTFQKYVGNPILTSDKECRDPNMFWNEKTERWNLFLANALEHEMLIYSSSNLKDWTFESSFGKDFGCQNGVWECPDLLELPVRGTKEKKWVLICNINPGGPFGGSATQYFVGEFDGHKFTCDDKPEVTKWMDYGKDHYATVSWSNQPKDRTVVVAWMSNWQYAAAVPTQQYRSANSLPRTLELYKDEKGDYLVAVEPVKEVEEIREKPLEYGSFKVGNKAIEKSLPTANNGICEINMKLKGAANQKIDIVLSNAKGNRLVMQYDLSKSTFSMDRAQSGLTNFHPDFAAVTTASTPEGTTQSLRLFIDASSIEAFEGQGRFAMTNLVFPEEPYNKISIQMQSGKCHVSNLTVYPLNPQK